MPDRSTFTPAEWQAIARISLAVLLSMMALIIAYLGYRWKVRSDQHEMETLKTERIRMEMEALAAEKKAQRKSAERAANVAKKERPQAQETPPDEPCGFDDSVPLG
jgi:Tfp pilus assembly protein PilO